MNTKILFVGNYKGGVGKTTSVLNFAKYFSQARNSVLVLDLDPQSSLSEILVNNNFSNRQLRDFEKTKTLNYVFDLYISKIKKYPSIDLQFDTNIVQHYTKENFDFIASSLFYEDKNGNELGLDELAVRMEDNVAYLSILKQFLNCILKEKKYDYVLIDCPPSNNLITRSAFLSSDFYIIPTVLDRISTNGVAHYINTVEKTYKKYCKDSEDSTLMKHYFGPAPKLIGIFCTFIRNQVNYNEAMEALRTAVSGGNKDIHIFKEEINNYIDIARSTEVGVAAKARNDYEGLSKEVLNRLAKMEKEV